MDREYPDEPTGSKTFDESKTLVFRDHKENMRMTAANCEVVDVHFPAGRYYDKCIDLSVTFLWDAIEGESLYYSSCKVTADDVTVQAFYDLIRRKDSKMLHQLCGSLFRKYGAKLQHVKTNPLTLYMVHQNKNMCDAMLSDPRISELISGYVGPILRLTWSDRARQMIVEHQLVIKKVTEKDSRVKELENHRQSLINTYEAHFEGQAAINRRIWSMIEKLQLLMSKMNTTTNLETNETGKFAGETAETASRDHGVFETRGQINQSIEGNSDLSSRGYSGRDTVGDGQHQIWQMANKSNINILVGEIHIHYPYEDEDEDEDEDEVKDENNTQDVARKDEPNKTTVNISQITNDHVQGTKVTLVTKGSRSQDKERKVDMYTELMGK